MNPSALRVSHLSDPRQTAAAVNNATRRTDPLELTADQLTLTVDRAFSVAGDIAAVNAVLTGNISAVAGTLTSDLTVVNVNASGVYKVASTQVVGARSTGWTADTGTAEKGAHATYAAGSTLTFTDPPTAGEMSALATRLAAIETALQGATRGQKALKDAQLTHGLIGT